jgi:hypothetical protein
MYGYLKDAAVTLAGIVTSLLTILVLFVIQHLTGFELFTLSVWLVVPVGALVCGGFAASGYYFGAIFLHRRPNAILAIQMLIVAGATMLAEYYLNFYTLVIDGQNVRAVVPFLEYLKIVIESSEYVVGRSQTNLGAVGNMGYWIFGIQFFGLLIGGIAVFGHLLLKPHCGVCSDYYKLVGRKMLIGESSTDTAAIFDEFYFEPLDSPQFASTLSEDSLRVENDGTVFRVQSSLYQCKKCAQQMIENVLQRKTSNDWVEERGLINSTHFDQVSGLHELYAKK